MREPESGRALDERRLLWLAAVGDKLRDEMSQGLRRTSVAGMLNLSDILSNRNATTLSLRVRG